MDRVLLQIRKILGQAGFSVGFPLHRRCVGGGRQRLLDRGALDSISLPKEGRYGLQRHPGQDDGQPERREDLEEKSLPHAIHPSPFDGEA